MNLVIVESPAKSRTIEKFLGTGFKVLASYGHLRDLPKSEVGVDIEHNFAPKYIIPVDSKRQAELLKKEMLKADTIYLATDLDREGEAISWHVKSLITEDKKISKETREKTEKKFKRIQFNEITKDAILNAVKNPREINQNLVDAQQARRVLDRLVGYELSPVLWRKVKPGLSAGRVQSVLVRLIVEREREIIAFESKSSFKISAEFLTEKKELINAELNEKKETKKQSLEFLEKCKTAQFSVLDLEKKPAKKSPAPPFTTSTLQQEASRKFGFSVSQTMQVAQRLYEKGAITYMRTDSLNLSNEAISQATTEIKKQFGEKFVKVRHFKTKAKGAQEAHEAIRPTHFNVLDIDGDFSEAKLYNLIWKRAIASQMAEAELEKTNIKIGISNSSENFLATGEVIKFEGFLKVYFESRDSSYAKATEDRDEEEESLGILPTVKVGESLVGKKITAIERFSKHPPRYTEASLVKKLEELGIGRPSTYAPTISTVQKRGYVVKEERAGTERNFEFLCLENNKISEEIKTENTGYEKNKLFPTDTGMVVTDFLLINFKEILDYNFTAKVEDEFDDVAEGDLGWTIMLQNFYVPFHGTVEQVAKTSERSVGERLLGKDPKSGRDVVARLGKFGPLVQIGRKDEKEKQIFAPLRPGQRLENITFEEALELFKLPRTLGELDGEEVVVSIGKFGPYIRHKSEFISLPKQDDPYEVTFTRVKEILEGPRLPKDLGEFEGKMLSVGKGFYGPFVKYDGAFASIPKAFDPLEITFDQALEIMKEKLKKDSEKLIKKWDENSKVKIVNGKYGPCIQAGRKFFKIPAGKNAEELTLQECIEIAGLNKVKVSRKRKKRK